MKILLVDDASSVVKVMTARLNSYGHDVVYAVNGADALEKFAANCPDLVLMDIEMPVMNGFESASRIRAIEATQQWAWTPIIFLTSSDTVDNLVTAIEAGGNDFMSKFVPEPVLHAKMKAMGRIATLRQRLSVANQKLQSLADHDGLTGLFNRRSLDMQADLLWAQAQYQSHAFAVVMVDVDNFKKYNDRYGHLAGDDCLRQVAQCIEETVHKFNVNGMTSGAFVARYGGEEFAVVVPNPTVLTFKKLLTSIVENIRLQNIEHLDNADWRIVTVSVGGVRCEKPEGELLDVFALADQQLFIAKKNGRNRFECTMNKVVKPLDSTLAAEVVHGKQA